jgi:quinol monooxygenase YgiN
MNNLIVMTTATAKPGNEQAVRQALLDVAAAAREQESCVSYRVLEVIEDSATTINVEEWSSEEARNAFLEGLAVKTFIETVDGRFVTSPQPIEYREATKV